MATPVVHSLMTVLKRVPGFDRLDDADLLEVVGASVNLIWPAGECIFQKGLPGEALYIVLSGKVLIYDEVGDHEVEIARTGPGEYFGEISLLLDTTHTKNVKALEDTELLVLSKDSFAELLKSNPDLEAHLREMLESRLSEAKERYETSAPTP